LFNNSIDVHRQSKIVSTLAKTVISSFSWGEGDNNNKILRLQCHYQ